MKYQAEVYYSNPLTLYESHSLPPPMYESTQVPGMLPHNVPNLKHFQLDLGCPPFIQTR